MKYMLHSFLIIIAVSIIAVLLFGGIIFVNAVVTIGGPQPISMFGMQREFSGNKAIVKDVAEYLKKQEYSYITISYDDKKSGEMYVSGSNTQKSEYIKIADDSVAENIADLFGKYKYERITKDGNGIYFQRSSNLKYGSGVVYSIDDEEPQGKRFTQLSPLSEKSWYYYISR
jgi:hypothetical protein